MSYRAAMPRLLREVGWMVESDEFTEIEDPDPDNHEERQRELINEIEEARKQLQERPEKKRFGFFKRNKKVAEKKDQEMYDESNKAEQGAKEGGEERTADGVLFDVDAIRAEVAELAGHGIKIKQLESTLPPMKLNLEPAPQHLRATKSFNDSASPPSHSRDDSVRQSSNADRLGLSRNTSKSSTFDNSGTKATPNSESGDTSATFDTSASQQFDHTEHAPTSYTSSGSLAPEYHSLNTTPSPALSSAWGTASTLQRPPLEPHLTMPTVTKLEHNAWADEDNEFGRETEMKMTFE